MVFFKLHYLYLTMARTISRKDHMSKVLQLRCHEEDLANIRIAAMNAGKDMSAFVRDILIKEKVINPV